LITDLYFTITW